MFGGELPLVDCIGSVDRQPMAVLPSTEIGCSVLGWIDFEVGWSVGVGVFDADSGVPFNGHEVGAGVLAVALEH